MFPLQLKPNEYKDFILILNYDLSVLERLWYILKHVI